jgi:predicted Zn-dependent protease
MRYRRADEAEADREGMNLIQAAHVDPAGMVDFFGTLAGRDSSNPRIIAYLSSHPQTDQRQNEMRRLSESATYAPQPFESAHHWNVIRHACSPPEN